jgi:hypothetical protein
MADHDARSRAVYDHDNEEPRPTGRRRRQVADWGVGEEIFDHMPGRRFERRPHKEIPRGDADDGRRTIVIESDAPLPAPSPQQPAYDEEFASRDEALRAREAHDELWAGDEPFAPPRAEPRDEDTEFVAASGGQHDTGEFTPVASDEIEDPAAPETLRADGQAERTDGIVRGGVEGRRTVKIGGRPAEWHGTPARTRRPPRTMHERLGPRPDRVAMWAFALGILLILIAIATANA